MVGVGREVGEKYCNRERSGSGVGRGLGRGEVLEEVMVGESSRERY